LDIVTDITKRLAVFERNVLRVIIWGVKVNTNWRKRYSEELMQMFGDLDTLFCCCQNKSVALDC
jgi:hypothetical protein